ncbi:thioredoxin O2, mitochondrial-like isoform X1 [Primulina tabacum]|uniref:thioredoxin O2, mitochondrial-like isoform X1 n=1 Tax=Primulina tabacum TaxID=48773 RepID=UPI003F5A0726
MKGLSVVIRRLVADTAPRTVARSSSISQSLVLSSAAAYSALLIAEDKTSPRFISSIAPGGAFNYQSAVQTHFRSFSSSSSSDPSNIVSIESKEQFTDSLRKVQDESLPAIFYFTAVWCGPCRLLSPVIGQLSEKYPHVTTYKIDIDKEELGNELSKLNIHSVPTLLFFLNGKKASEVIGADLQRLKDTMEALYK